MMSARWKSLVLRVTSVRPCSCAVAAMSASVSGIGSGTCSRAVRRATHSSTARIDPANAAGTSVVSDVRRCAPDVLSRRSRRRTPRSSSSSAMTLIARSARGCAEELEIARKLAETV